MTCCRHPGTIHGCRWYLLYSELYTKLWIEFLEAVHRPTITRKKAREEFIAAEACQKLPASELNKLLRKFANCKDWLVR
jgi:hypothetical protein